MSSLSLLALLGLCIAAVYTQSEEQPTQPPQQITESPQDLLADVIFKLEVLQECLFTKPGQAVQPQRGSRTKRQAVFGYPYGFARDYLGLGLGFRRYDYNIFPNTLGYDRRYSAYYPEDLRLNIYQLPVARFFNSFYPGAIYRPAEGVVTRTFLRTGTYADALADFRLFPLQQVRTLTTTTTRTSVAEPGYVGVFRDFPYEVRVCSDCCSEGLPCITFTGQTFPYRQVVRNFVYTRNTRYTTGVNTVVDAGVAPLL